MKHTLRDGPLQKPRCLAGGPLAGPAVLSEVPDTGSEAIRPEDLVPADILDGGEIIILAVKPSLWFVVLKSSRWLAGALLAMLMARWLEEALPVSRAVIVQAALALAAARVGWGLLQWVSRLYILTNRRIMRLTGVFHIDVFDCQLTKIQSTFMAMNWYERLFSIGTISFATAGAGTIEVSWTHVNNPVELHERVRSAIHRAQRPGPGL